MGTAILVFMEPHYALFLCAVKMQKPFSFVTNQCRPSDVQIKNCKESRLPVNWTDQGILKGGKYDCTIDLLFDWFGLVCFANKNKKISVVIQLIPNQSNRRSTVQQYFPL
jgi:hypothetical protein